MKKIISSFPKKEIIVKCNCGDPDHLLIISKDDFPSGGIYIFVKPVIQTIWQRIKYVWKGEQWTFDMCVDKSVINELIKELQEIQKEDK